MKLYRIGNYFHRHNIPIIPTLINGLIRLIHNSAVYSETRIGKGTFFGYGGIAVVVHKGAVIGEDCMIGSNVTIGGKSKRAGLPVIGDRVYISTGARILGDIVIGSDSVIGANAVVIKNVPPNSIVAGVPAKIIKSGIDSKDYR
ncbi:MAG: serine O-acetyltransferase [Oleispira sp.]|jgi:serine O-acetyltransferase